MSSTVPAQDHETFTVAERPRIPVASVVYWLFLFVVMLAGFFLIGAGASWGDTGDGNAWVFSAGVLVTSIAFFIPLTFRRD